MDSLAMAEFEARERARVEMVSALQTAHFEPEDNVLVRAMQASRIEVHVDADGKTSIAIDGETQRATQGEIEMLLALAKQSNPSCPGVEVEYDITAEGLSKKAIVYTPGVAKKILVKSRENPPEAEKPELSAEEVKDLADQIFGKP